MGLCARRSGLALLPASGAWLPASRQTLPPANITDSVQKPALARGLTVGLASVFLWVAGR
jgi:hypothetical protein